MIVIVDNGDSYEDRKTYFVAADSVRDVEQVVRQHNQRHTQQAEILGTCDKIEWRSPPLHAVPFTTFQIQAAEFGGL